MSVLWCIQYCPLVLLTHNVKMIKGASYQNGDVDDMCERNFMVTDIQSLNSLDNLASFHRIFCQFLLFSA